jgi:CBS-domain-containing membrane protein
MSAAVFNTTFSALAAGDTVADATARMLADRVTDLPVVDGDGRLVGMFRLDRLLGLLLPKAALLGYGVEDLTFVGETLDQLRERLREIDDRPVREFAVRPDHVVQPETTPLEIVLLLYRGANNVPVVDAASGKLVGMTTARDVLASLQGGGAR